MTKTKQTIECNTEPCSAQDGWWCSTHDQHADDCQPLSTDKHIHEWIKHKYINQLWCAGCPEMTSTDKECTCLLKGGKLHLMTCPAWKPTPEEFGLDKKTAINPELDTVEQQEWEKELRILMAKFAMYLGDENGEDDHEGWINSFKSFISFLLRDQEERIRKEYE